MALPNDLIEEIIVKTPAKAIARFATVCDGWNSMRKTTYFINKYFSSSKDDQVLFFYTEGLKRTIKFSFFPTLQNDLTLSSNAVQVALKDKYYNHVSSSVRGLICIGHGRNCLIFNPLTSQKIVIPKLRSSNVGVRTYLGFDPVNNKFKVRGLPIMVKHHQIITVRDQEWRNIISTEPHCRPTKGISLNNFIYYGAWSSLNLEHYMIMVFNIVSEQYEDIIQLPPAITYGAGTKIKLFKHQSKLAILNTVSSGQSTMWIYDKEWTKKVELSGISTDWTCKGSITGDTLVFVPKRYNTFQIQCYNVNTKRSTVHQIDKLEGNDFIGVRLNHIPNPYTL